MSLTSNIVINTYSILLLILIFYRSIQNAEKKSLQYKLFTMMLLVTMLLLVVDIFSRFDGKPDTIYSVFNRVGNFLSFLFNTFLPSLWLLYVYSQVYQEKRRIKRLILPLSFVNAANAVMVILSQFFGWYYYIDTNNIYHRGPVFLLSALIVAAMTLFGLILIIVYRKKIEKRHYASLVFFSIPPIISIILQIFIYGISLMLNSVVLSLLMLFFNVQYKSIYTDYLTGTYNRKRLDIYLNEKINASTPGNTFSAIMLDLDNFKNINDSFGHDMGDKALSASVKLLKSCFRSSDFIARFGGDEFYIVFDISDTDELNSAVNRIKARINKVNRSGAHPFKLSFSMGYAVYDYDSHMKAEEFQKQLDALMYADKRTCAPFCD